MNARQHAEEAARLVDSFSGFGASAQAHAMTAIALVLTSEEMVKALAALGRLGDAVNDAGHLQIDDGRA